MEPTAKPARLDPKARQQALAVLRDAIEDTPDFQDVTIEACRVLRTTFPHYNWVGVYMVEGQELVLSGWDGPQATEHTRIPIGQGICGLAARTGKTVNVPDVNADPGYLACFLSTRSELVVPIFLDGKVVGEIDVDSDRPGAFGPDDEAFVAEFAKLLATAAK
ncbi:MAG TPA: GAF domain-containing protein [Candidatus Thermoplasmatota archaeon]|nr:GAF domain-containing protein [Candidatus Thermoplasmatota archaeon]